MYNIFSLCIFCFPQPFQERISHTNREVDVHLTCFYQCFLCVSVFLCFSQCFIPFMHSVTSICEFFLYPSWLASALLQFLDICPGITSVSYVYDFLSILFVCAWEFFFVSLYSTVVGSDHKCVTVILIKHWFCSY